MGVCRSQNIQRQQSELDQPENCQQIKKMIEFMGRKQQHLAQQFADELYKKQIQTYEILVKVVKQKTFPEFEEFYYPEMSRPQQTKFLEDLQKEVMEEKLVVQFKYTIYSSQTNLNTSKDFYLLVIGITGNGKTTFINSLCSCLTLNSSKNYLESEKQILVDEKEYQKSGSSVTKKITKYSIYTNHNNKCYGIHLIDTPGLNDTAGPKQEKTIVSILLIQIDDLGDYLLKEVPYLDLILLVSKEQELYNKQERISMQSVVKLLGIDTPRFTKQILTFSELSKNINEDKFRDNVMELFYKNQAEPKYYQFQNSLMFMEGNVSYLDTLRLQRNLKNFKMLLGGKFFENPNKDHLNLTETKNVIQYRRQIKAFLAKLGENLNLLVLKLLANNNNQKALIECQNQVQKSSNFFYWKQVLQIEKKDCDEGFTTTFCIKCDTTCHDRCEIQNERGGCIVFINGRCFSGDCMHGIDDHVKSNTIITHKLVLEKFEYEDVKDAFNQAITQQQQIENEMKRLNLEQQDLREKICLNLASVFIRDQQLRKSALFHDIQSNADEYYIDEIKQQYNTQSNFIAVIEKVRELYFENKQQHLSTAKQKLDPVDQQ